MPYANTAAVSRPEISAFLEEAIATERYFIGQLIMPIFTSKSRAGRYPPAPKPASARAARP